MNLLQRRRRTCVTSLTVRNAVVSWTPNKSPVVTKKVPSGKELQCESHLQFHRHGVAPPCWPFAVIM